MKKTALLALFAAAIACIAGAIPSPIAYYSFDPVKGRIVDSIGKDSTVVPPSVSIKPDGIVGNCISLKRQEDSYVALGRRFGFSGDFSISFWLRTAPGYRETGTIVLGRHAAGWYNGYFFMLNAEWGYGATDKITFYYSNATAVSSRSVNDGRWHQIGIIVKKGEGAFLFVDGVLDAKGPPNAMVVPDVDLTLGAITWDKPHGNFAGDIDELAFFDRAIEIPDMAAMAASPNWFQASQGFYGPPPQMYSSAMGSSMRITLKNGQVLSLPTADIAKIEFAP